MPHEYLICFCRSISLFSWKNLEKVELFLIPWDTRWKQTSDYQFVVRAQYILLRFASNVMEKFKSSIGNQIKASSKYLIIKILKQSKYCSCDAGIIPIQDQLVLF